MNELKDAGIMLKLAYQAMLRAGIDVDRIFGSLGIDEAYINSTQLRTPHEAQSLFWRLLEAETGDQDIGLHLGQHLPVYKGQILEYLFLSSPTFGDGLTRVLNYQRLLSDVADSQLETAPDWPESYLRMNASSSTVGIQRHFNECFAQGVVTFFRSITDNQFQPTHIEFSHEEPENAAEVEKVFGCKVMFGQSENRLFFATKLLSLSSPHAEPELLALHEQYAIQQVAKLEKEDIVAQVGKIIAELLESGDVTLESVASKLDIKPRTLRTRLSEVETNFNQILADFRYRLARHLLAGTDESIDEIVYLTGFSEPSTFYRAFKRWSNMTPIEYRKSKQSSND